MRHFNRDRKSGRRYFNRSSYGDSKRFDRDSARSERRDFRKEVEMHSATCDRCGARCEVPFRPSGSKPVYCSDCFRKGEVESKSPDQYKKDQYKKEFDLINEKLDKILEALGKD